MLIAHIVDETDAPDSVPVNDMLSEFNELEDEDLSQPSTASQESYHPSQSQHSSSQASSNNDEVKIFYLCATNAKLHRNNWYLVIVMFAYIPEFGGINL